MPTPAQNIKNASELKRERLQKLIEGKRHNKEEVQRFFMELYEAEKDPFAPVDLSKTFEGIYIPDIRVPGQGLEDRWPHYFVVKTDPTDPDFPAYQPLSPEYEKEFKELVNLIRAIRTVAAEENRKADEICAQQSQARN